MSTYLDDLVPGTVAELGSHLFTAADIIAFATAYDPQPFHIDEVAASDSHFGALCASGWHTAAIWMRLMVAHRNAAVAAATAAGQPVPGLGPSPGFRELKWPAPVFAGDTITYRSTYVGGRATASRPGWGIARHENTGHNQNGVLVFSFQGSAFWQRRPG
jgi:acyl dehydratase